MATRGYLTSTWLATIRMPARRISTETREGRLLIWPRSVSAPWPRATRAWLVPISPRAALGRWSHFSLGPDNDEPDCGAHRADIYGLGMVLLEAITGSAPPGKVIDPDRERPAIIDRAPSNLPRVLYAAARGRSAQSADRRGRGCRGNGRSRRDYGRFSSTLWNLTPATVPPGKRSGRRP